MAEDSNTPSKHHKRTGSGTHRTMVGRCQPLGGESMRWIKDTVSGLPNPHDAAARNKVAKMRKYTMQGGDVNKRNNLGDTPLHEACAYVRDQGDSAKGKKRKMVGKDRRKIGKRLPSQTTEIPREGGPRDMLELLINAGAQIDARNIVGDAPLHKAALNGRSVATDFLVGAGADVNIRNEFAQTPLHAACVSGNIDVVRCLVQGGADISAQDAAEDTPFHEACRHQYEGIVIYLMGLVNKPTTTQGLELWEGLDPGWEEILRSKAQACAENAGNMGEEPTSGDPSTKNLKAVEAGAAAVSTPSTAPDSYQSGGSVQVQGSTPSAGQFANKVSISVPSCNTQSMSPPRAAIRSSGETQRTVAEGDEVPKTPPACITPRLPDGAGAVARVRSHRRSSAGARRSVDGQPRDYSATPATVLAWQASKAQNPQQERLIAKAREMMLEEQRGAAEATSASTSTAGIGDGQTSVDALNGDRNASSTSRRHPTDHVQTTNGNAGGGSRGSGAARAEIPNQASVATAPPNVVHIKTPTRVARSNRTGSSSRQPAKRVPVEGVDGAAAVPSAKAREYAPVKIRSVDRSRRKQPVGALDGGDGGPVEIGSNGLMVTSGASWPAVTPEVFEVDVSERAAQASASRMNMTSPPVMMRGEKIGSNPPPSRRRSSRKSKAVALASPRAREPGSHAGCMHSRGSRGSFQRNRSHSTADGRLDASLSGSDALATDLANGSHDRQRQRQRQQQQQQYPTVHVQSVPAASAAAASGGGRLSPEAASRRGRGSREDQREYDPRRRDHRAGSGHQPLERSGSRSENRGGRGQQEGGVVLPWEMGSFDQHGGAGSSSGTRSSRRRTHGDGSAPRSSKSSMSSSRRLSRGSRDRGSRDGGSRDSGSRDSGSRDSGSRGLGERDASAATLPWTAGVKPLTIIADPASSPAVAAASTPKASDPVRQFKRADRSASPAQAEVFSVPKETMGSATARSPAGDVGVDGGSGSDKRALPSNETAVKPDKISPDGETTRGRVPSPLTATDIGCCPNMPRRPKRRGKGSRSRSWTHDTEWGSVHTPRSKVMASDMPKRRFSPSVTRHSHDGDTDSGRRDTNDMKARTAPSPLILVSPEKQHMRSPSGDRRVGEEGQGAAVGEPHSPLAYGSNAEEHPPTMTALSSKDGHSPKILNEHPPTMTALSSKDGHSPKILNEHPPTMTALSSKDGHSPKILNESPRPPARPLATANTLDSVDASGRGEGEGEMTAVNALPPALTEVQPEVKKAAASPAPMENTAKSRMAWIVSATQTSSRVVANALGASQKLIFSESESELDNSCNGAPKPATGASSTTETSTHCSVKKVDVDEGQTDMKATPKASTDGIDGAVSPNDNHSPSGDILTVRPIPQQPAAMTATSCELEESAPERSSSSAGAGAGPVPEHAQESVRLPAGAEEALASTQDPMPEEIKSVAAAEVAVATGNDQFAPTEQPVMHVSTKDSIPTEESRLGELRLAVEAPAAMEPSAGRGGTPKEEPSPAPQPLAPPKLLAREATEAPPPTVEAKGKTVETKGETVETKRETVETKGDEDKAAGNGDENNPASVGVREQESNPAAAVVNASRPKSFDHDSSAALLAAAAAAAAARKSGTARPRSMLGRPGRAPLKVTMPIVGGRAAWNKFLATADAEETDTAGTIGKSSPSTVDATTKNGSCGKQSDNATGLTATSDVEDSLDSAGAKRVSEEGIVADGVASDVGVSAVERRGPPRGFKAPVAEEGPNKGPAGAFSGNSMWRLAGGASSTSSAAKNSLAANGHGGYSNPLAAMRANGGVAAAGSASGGACSGPVGNVANPLAGLRGVGGTAGLARANPLARGSVVNPLTRGGAGRSMNPLARGGRGGGPGAGSERAGGGSAAGGGTAYNVNPLRRGNTTLGLPPGGGSTVPTQVIQGATSSVDGTGAMNGGIARDRVVGADAAGAAVADGNTKRSFAAPAHNGPVEQGDSSDESSTGGPGAKRVADFNVVTDFDVVDELPINGRTQHSGFRVIGARGGGVPSVRGEQMNHADRDPGQAQVASLVMALQRPASNARDGLEIRDPHEGVEVSNVAEQGLVRLLRGKYSPRQSIAGKDTDVF